MKRWTIVLLCVCLLPVSCASNKALRREKAETFRQLGEGYLAEGNTSSALRELLKAKDLNSKDPYTHYDLGLAYLAKDQFDLAVDHFEKALELKADYPQAENAIGAVYLQQEKWDKAIPYFKRALDDLLYATPHIVLNNLGEAYRGKEAYGRALSFYKKALEENPRFVKALQNMGATYLALGNYDAAIGSLERAERYASSSASIQFDLGRAYAGAFETEKAMLAFKKAVALAPDSALAKQAQARIQQLAQ